MRSATRVEFKMFRGLMISWENLLREAADFASALAPEQLISISHSADHSDGIVTVWYWSSPPSLRDDRE
jgi:hypothetical protein